jgi:hypothetical protein
MNRLIAAAVAAAAISSVSAQTANAPTTQPSSILGVTGGRFVFGEPAQYAGYYLLDTQSGRLWKLTRFCEDAKRNETCDPAVMAPVFFEHAEARVNLERKFTGKLLASPLDEGGTPQAQVKRPPRQNAATPSP